ncbi:hypothetical protein BROUX41_003516 [Berkeleyomyces rouxiae]|uniref:uncharacterized protein n=1 Tax=Berkeleyomyces rouxiae TaxID=2035830 RepID=UPI003B7B17F4
MSFTSLQAFYNTAKEALPFLPGALRTTILHFTGMDELSAYHEYTNLLILTALRTFANPSPAKSISESQALDMAVGPIRGRIWISTYTAPVPPEPSARDVLLALVRELSPDAAGFDAMLRRATRDGRLPLELAAVEGEWTGYRAGVDDTEPPPDVSDREMFDAMQEDCSRPATVLYFHGGAYYLMDPATHRDTCKKIAKDTGGRVYSVRYRLAPQNPFPSALLDALVSYLTLLYPPPGAFHEAVKPEHIVFAGDSAGGNLALVLMRTLLELHRRQTPITWHGRARAVPLPAAVAVNSPWCDIGLSLPDVGRFADFDYLPSTFAAWHSAPPCTAWNNGATAGRSHVYCLDGLLDHPLTSPVVADGWAGAPPVYICAGWEVLASGIKHTAQKLHRQGVCVVYDEFEGMPHCFAMVLPGRGARRCFDAWTGFIRDAVEQPAALQSRATAIKAKTLEEAPLEFEALSPFDDADVRAWAARVSRSGQRDKDADAEVADEAVDGNGNPGPVAAHL